MNLTVLSVPGMSCDHCVRAITAEVSAVPGVTGVEVSLETGTVTVRGAADRDALRAAVDEAGYEVAAEVAR